MSFCSVLRRPTPTPWLKQAVKCRQLHACIVGSGPAGFYTAQHLLKKGPSDLHVDIVDRLPVPFGLVRYGVAPHHQDVKNVINQFSELAKSERCSFFGNVDVGRSVSVEELRQLYDVVILAYGASTDRKLGTPGESLPNVVSAREFVGWYNGLPENRELRIDLSAEAAVIFGLGNVALDVAMMLLSPIAFLEKTDISEHALEQLRHRKVKKVFLVGRRGPLEAAFTIKECKELIRIADCRPVLAKSDFAQFTDEGLAKLARPRKRLTKLLCDTACTTPAEPELQRRDQASKEWEMLFHRSPVEIVSNEAGSVSAVKLEKNRLVNGQAEATGEFETLECGLVFRSIGYRGSGLGVDSDAMLKFDARRGVIANLSGRTECPGVYCSGWIKHGPTGTIVDTLNDALETADTILHDLKASESSGKSKSSASRGLLERLSKEGIQVVTFPDWLRINSVEVERGRAVGKPREKVVDVAEMLAIARQER